MKQSLLTHDVYFYVDADGERNFPSADAVQQDAERGIHTILVLDANVCLELATYAQGQKDAKKDFDARHFLLSVELAKLDVAPLLGCMELAAHKNCDSIDLAKFSQLATNVNRALNQTEWSLAHGHLPGTGQIFKPKQTPELTSFYPLLRYFYCAF